MSRFRIVAAGLGLVLLFAGLMKYLALTEAAINPDLLGRDWWALLIGFMAEVVLGLWMLAGLFPTAVRWLALLCFCSFATLSFQKGASGEATCGCFGSLQINPWITFVFDLLALLALFASKPTVAREEGPGAWGFLGLAGIVVLGLGLGARAYESVTSISRGLILSERHHEFGVSRQGQHLTHVFTLENRCGFPVEITEAKTMCFCTSFPDMTGSIIEPGSTFEVPVTLATGDSHEHLMGGLSLFCKKVGSTATPSFFGRLQVSAKVDADYDLRPTVLDFGTITGEMAEVRKVFVRPHRMKGVEILEIQSPSPAFRGAVAKDKTAEGDLVLEITFDGRKSIRSERFQVPIIVRTSSTGSPVFRLLAFGTYESPLTIEPSAIIVGSDQRGEIVREIRLTSSSRVTIGTVATTGGSRALIVPVGSEGKGWQVTVRIPEAESNGEVRFAVTGMGEPREIAVPVHRFIPSPKGD